MLVLLLFFCSGATALVYEVLWSKYLSLMLGSTVQAQTVVLAVFMGGLAIGNRLFGGRARSFSEPLGMYGYLEIAIGIYAYVFYFIYNGADALFVTVGRTVAEQSTILLALKLLISVGLLILPTILMGGTLPLLAAWIERQPGLDSASKIGIFYATNSLGAVAGAGLAGFYLVSSFGLEASIRLTALSNLLIGLAAIILSKRALNELRGAPKSPAIGRSALPSSASVGWFGFLVAATGGASMGLEVISARALVLIVGGSLQAFALVLMSFIFGIGIGSIAISSSQIARRLGLSTIYLLLLVAAVFVVLNVIFIENLAMLFANAKFGLALNESGWLWHQAMVALIAFIVLGLPAAFLGAVVPLSIKLLEKDGGELAERVGRLLTWNTLGAVTGVLLTGFVLMPLLGLRGALVAIALLLMTIVAVISARRGQQLVTMTAAVFIIGTIVAATTTGQQWKEVLSAGIFRLRGRMLNDATLQGWKSGRELLYYKDAADATVSVERSLSVSTRQLTLRINGKSDASTHGDLSTQMLLAHLPMAAKPDARQVFVLGFGSGITAGSLLAHPIDRLTIAENCKPVLEAGQLFSDWNRGVLTNERVTIRNDDARAVLKLGDKKYDIIISEPSNPWVVGVGSVFSQEFYQIAASNLTEDGIMAQWFHIYEMSDQIVLLVIRTFASMFPHVELWDTQSGDIVLLGSKKPWASNPASYQKIFERPAVKKDLENIGIPNPVALWMRQMASQHTAFAIPGDGPVQTDEFPILEYSAPRAFFMGARSTALSIFDERTLQFPLAPPQKVMVMRAMPVEMIKATFGTYETGTDDLSRYFAAALKDPKDLPGISPLLMIAFRQPDTYPEDPPTPKDASPEYAALQQHEADLLRHPEDWKRSLLAIEAILTRLIEQNKLSPDFIPGYFPALAAKIAMSNQDYATALRLLRIGFVLSPDDLQLLYLSRVLDRLVPEEMLAELRAVQEVSGTNQLQNTPSNQTFPPPTTGQ